MICSNLEHLGCSKVENSLELYMQTLESLVASQKPFCLELETIQTWKELAITRMYRLQICLELEM
jgi:hypothetical protein